MAQRAYSEPFWSACEGSSHQNWMEKIFGPERPTLGREIRPPKLEWVGDPLLVLLDNGSALENLFQPASPGTA